MSRERDDRLLAARLSQPLDELERKANKATRRGYFTQEDIDWAKAQAKSMHAYFRSFDDFPSGNGETEV